MHTEQSLNDLNKHGADGGNPAGEERKSVGDGLPSQGGDPVKAGASGKEAAAEFANIGEIEQAHLSSHKRIAASLEGMETAKNRAGGSTVGDELNRPDQGGTRERGLASEDETAKGDATRPGHQKADTDASTAGAVPGRIDWSRNSPAKDDPDMRTRHDKSDGHDALILESAARSQESIQESNQKMNSILGDLAMETKQAAAAHGESLRAIHAAIMELRKAHQEVISRLNQPQGQ